jgi:hypothetical protein
MDQKYTMSQSVQIKNVEGRSHLTPRCDNCGTWIGHWERRSGLTAGKCCVDGCNSLAAVGAHVTRPRATNDDLKTHAYIVPMCHAHNNVDGGTFMTKPGVTFVWANVKRTCGAV